MDFKPANGRQMFETLEGGPRFWSPASNVSSVWRCPVTRSVPLLLHVLQPDSGCFTLRSALQGPFARSRPSLSGTLQACVLTIVRCKRGWDVAPDTQGFARHSFPGHFATC